MSSDEHSAFRLMFEDDLHPSPVIVPLPSSPVAAPLPSSPVAAPLPSSPVADHPPSPPPLIVPTVSSVAPNVTTNIDDMLTFLKCNKKDEKQTLWVLDVDETLICVDRHAMQRGVTDIAVRPYVSEFLQELEKRKQLVIIWSAGDLVHVQNCCAALGSSASCIRYALARGDWYTDSHGVKDVHIFELGGSYDIVHIDNGWMTVISSYHSAIIVEDFNGSQTDDTFKYLIEDILHLLFAKQQQVSAFIADITSLYKGTYDFHWREYVLPERRVKKQFVSKYGASVVLVVPPTDTSAQTKRSLLEARSSSRASSPAGLSSTSSFSTIVAFDDPIDIIACMDESTEPMLTEIPPFFTDTNAADEPEQINTI